MQSNSNTQISTVVAGVSPSILNPKSVAIVKASKGHLIKTLQSSDEGRMSVAAAIEWVAQKGFLMRGWKYESEGMSDEEVTQKTVEISLVLLDFPWLTIEEFKLLCEEGLKGNLCEGYGINAGTINGWVKHYFQEFRMKPMKEQAEFERDLREEQEHRDKDEQYKKAHNRQLDSLCETYERLKSEGLRQWDEIPDLDPFNVFYGLLDKSKILPNDISLKNEIMDRLKEKFGIEDSKDTTRASQIIEKHFGLDRGSIMTQAKQEYFKRCIVRWIEEDYDLTADVQRKLKV